MNRLQDRVALVTGAASGIGLATSRAFIAEGARVVGLDVSRAPDGESFSQFVEADVRDEAAVSAAIESLGRLDVVVNAAGVAGGGPVHQLELAE